MPAQLERLYDDHAQALFAFLLNFTRDEADTRDVLQEVFIKLARQPDLLDSARNKRAFLLRLAHNAALVSGRAFALVWPGDDDQPEITLDNSSQMVIRYREGSRRKREAAMRFWTDDDTKRPYSTLYLPDGIYKFVGPKNSTGIDSAWPVITRA